ncbi:hypothetical protein PCG10_005126 [Penicillium crustosum]|uniref:Uncharacterized protein n=1 Tax=Penicillium crustosum TaxID=36656 RepID=A0A9P5KYL0_PENCR|nr:uncharacterized protein N7487_002616 [Penicillium crustosum]KAF7525241.1 hypothetical protein PCG10_005126 [Penicillium crustosum]KAJ5419066.1 hypothetical protein N7487_002616 [Penicillium crustosum]
MHFSSAAVLALCSIGVTYAAPFANPENEDLARRATYSVVNADEDSSSAVAREVDTVFETATVTAPGADPIPTTVTVTATPSGVFQSSTPVASSTPCWEIPNVLPAAGSNSFFRRGLRAAGQPALFAREYSSSSSAALYPTEYPAASAAESLYARGWYSAVSGTPSVATPTASPSSLVARGFGDLFSSASVSPASSVIASVTATPLAARGWYSSAATPSASATPLVARMARSLGDGSSSASPSYSSVNVPLSPTPIVARDVYASPSGTPASSSIPTSAAPLAVRGSYGWYSPVPSASSVATPSASPALVARGARNWGSSSVSSPVSSTFAASATPVVY